MLNGAAAALLNIFREHGKIVVNYKFKNLKV
jgi:hypothetical protein